ncbi:MAG: DUF1501 domain-containing protein [Pirellulales bacterium]|nr:DUF1501 domain-containing protein [Pirellulales bacterium]
MAGPDRDTHTSEHACHGLTSLFAPRANDLIRVGSRRWFLQTGLAGIAGLSLADVLRGRAWAASPESALQGASSATRATQKTSVIMFWLSGGPSHLDMWDPKPDAPAEIRGPFGTIPTKLPGVRFSEHLPLQASIADKLTVLRSIDCSASNHTPITMQAGNPLARRTDDGRDGDGYPSMGSIVAKFRGANDPSMPPFVGLADSWVADVWGAGHMGSRYEPVKGTELAGRFNLPKGATVERLQNRHDLRVQLDRLRRDLDTQHTLERLDDYHQQAFDMVLSGKVQKAFNLDEEKNELRDAYGRTSVGEKALLARRMVEAGVTFTLVSGAWGYFDHHGDEVKWGGIEKGLKPLLPTIDQTLYALITDLEERGLLDSTLVLMLGEFGRTPVMTKTAGRGHWTNCMSMLAAGGGLPHGQVVGATDARGYGIIERLITPQDLAATVFRFLDIDLNGHWMSPQGRPTPIVTEGGMPIAELVG